MKKLNAITLHVFLILQWIFSVNCLSSFPSHLRSAAHIYPMNLSPCHSNISRAKCAKCKENGRGIRVSSLSAHRESADSYENKELASGTWNDLKRNSNFKEMFNDEYREAKNEDKIMDRNSFSKNENKKRTTKNLKKVLFGDQKSNTASSSSSAWSTTFNYGSSFEKVIFALSQPVDIKSTKNRIHSTRNTSDSTNSGTHDSSTTGSIDSACNNIGKSNNYSTSNTAGDSTSKFISNNNTESNTIPQKRSKMASKSIIAAAKNTDSENTKSTTRNNSKIVQPNTTNSQSNTAKVPRLFQRNNSKSNQPLATKKRYIADIVTIDHKTKQSSTNEKGLVVPSSVSNKDNNTEPSMKSNFYIPNNTTECNKQSTTNINMKSTSRFPVIATESNKQRSANSNMPKKGITSKLNGTQTGENNSSASRNKTISSSKVTIQKFNQTNTTIHRNSTTNSNISFHHGTTTKERIKDSSHMNITTVPLILKSDASSNDIDISKLKVIGRYILIDAQKKKKEHKVSNRSTMEKLPNSNRVKSKNTVKKLPNGSEEILPSDIIDKSNSTLKKFPNSTSKKLPKSNIEKSSSATKKSYSTASHPDITADQLIEHKISKDANSKKLSKKTIQKALNIRNIIDKKGTLNTSTTEKSSDSTTEIQSNASSSTMKSTNSTNTEKEKVIGKYVLSQRPNRVDPPQRYIELTYNRRANDIFSWITTNSNEFGEFWSREHASRLTKKMRYAWLLQWMEKALKHNVAPADLSALVGINCDLSQKKSKATYQNEKRTQSISLIGINLEEFEAFRSERSNKEEKSEKKEFQATSTESDSKLEWTSLSASFGPALMKSVSERFTYRLPRVIIIGDVHGCVHELQELICECDYRPGDLLIFLGDLVAKGPHSVAVVTMARELGAICVRGNHDFEVLRCHGIMTNGKKDPLLTSKHYQIANSLSTDDISWLKSSPWYIKSRDLDALFVHAGFVEGIKMTNQNPRLMMTLRSVLPDNTATSKHFELYPWARLWKGPHTVFFGHDAERGLQVYDNAIGIDTGCVYGGRLTACILPERRLISVDAHQEYIKFKGKKS